MKDTIFYFYEYSVCVCMSEGTHIWGESPKE